MEKFSVKLTTLIKEHNLELCNNIPDIEERTVVSNDVYRPGLQLAIDFYDFFDEERILILGDQEMAYLRCMACDKRVQMLSMLFSRQVPAVIVTRGAELIDDLVSVSEQYSTPLLRTEKVTSTFMAALIASLNLHLAPRITRHGVLVEVYGEGILMLGESGVGKSETAIELVKRGHRLVADDAVEIKRPSAKTLIGSAPASIKHFIELRGIGIIDVQNIFGMGAVKDTEKIDFILHLEAWQQGKQYDRLGIDTEYTQILGVDVPSITIPVRPGRNLAVIVEVAAMNSRQKRMGYNAALALEERLQKEFNKEF